MLSRSHQRLESSLDLKLRLIFSSYSKGALAQSHKDARSFHDIYKQSHSIDMSTYLKFCNDFGLNLSL